MGMGVGVHVGVGVYMGMDVGADGHECGWVHMYGCWWECGGGGVYVCVILTGLAHH